MFPEVSKTEILEYAQEHGIALAAAWYGVKSSQIVDWLDDIQNETEILELETEPSKVFEELEQRNRTIRDVKAQFPMAAVWAIRLYVGQVLGYPVDETTVQRVLKGKPEPAQRAISPPSPWRPEPSPLKPGAWSVSLPILLPAQLRKSFRQDCHHMEVRVRVSGAQATPRPNPFLATTDGQRQHRRLSWTQRSRWNALPDKATVDIRILSRRMARHNSINRL